MNKKLKISDEKYKIWIIIGVIILLLTAFRYFFLLLGDYFTFLDEYPTFDTAVGFFKTGKFYQWDFHKNSLTDIKYSRAWPHTILLMLWFHIAGISVPAGKALSALLGIFFIFSIFYITYKIYNNYYITILSCLFLIGNPSVTVVFRQIRMYSLWMVFIVWFLYYTFQMLETEGSLTGKNRITNFYNKNFNYSIKYVFAAFITLILSYATHINTLVTGGGIILFWGYLLITKKEKRYITLLLALILTGMFVGLLCLLVSKGMEIPVAKTIYIVLTSDSFFGQYDPQNIRYLYWVRDFMGNEKLIIISCVCVIISFVYNCKRRDKKYDFSLFSVFISSTSLFCFMYVFSRYYQDRYMIYVAPCIAIASAWGIVEVTSILRQEFITQVIVSLFIMAIFFQVKDGYEQIYHNENICYHKQVYNKVKEDADVIPIAIAGYDFRDYYGAQIFEDYVTAAFDRKQDMEILYEFAKKYPRGYVMVETDKINGITEAMRIFMQNYSERIAGKGVDKYNIDVSRYYFLYPKIKYEKAEYNGIKYLYTNTNDKTQMHILLNKADFSPNTKILFLKFDTFIKGGEKNSLCCQLVFPEYKIEGNGIYEYSIIIDKPCSIIEMKKDCEVYYSDGSYEEVNLQW